MDCFSVSPSSRKAVPLLETRIALARGKDETYCLFHARCVLSFIQEKDGSALDSEHQWRFGGYKTFYEAERILDTDSLPAEQTHGWLKTSVDSGGDCGTQAFLPWLGLVHHRARLSFL